MRESAYTSMILTEGSKRKGAIYSPTSHTLVGFNFGTSVRPNVAPITVTSTGNETVESFLSRGGRVLTVAPKIAKGAIIVDGRVKSNPSHIRVSRG